MTNTLPRIQHGDSTVGYGWRLNDAHYPEAEFSIDDLSFGDDLPMVHEYYQKQIDDIQAHQLSAIIGADLYRYIVYILKFLELMSVQLGLQELTDSVILGHEAGSNPADQQKLAATWSAKSGAWLHLVGKSEAAASKAKAAISACDNDADMSAIVAEFPAELSEALSGL